MAPGTAPDRFGWQGLGRPQPPLNWVARLAPVIALVVGIPTMAISTAGILLDHTIEQDRVQRVRDDSDSAQAMRVHKRLEAKYEDDIVTIRNRWDDNNTLTGIVIVCDVGTILTGEANRTIGPTDEGCPHHDRDQRGLGGATLNHYPAWATNCIKHQNPKWVEIDIIVDSQAGGDMTFV